MNHKNKWKKDIKLLMVVFLNTLFFCLCLFFVFFSFRKVEGYAMMPQLKNNDVMLIRKKSSFKRFDVIFFKKGLKGDFSRIIGFPGEKVSLTDDTLFINDEPMDEKYLVEQINDAQIKDKLFTEDIDLTEQYQGSRIPPDTYLVLSDNRPYANDSREYGVISSSEILGKVVLRVFPLSHSIDCF